MCDRPSRQINQENKAASLTKSLRSQRLKIINELALELHKRRLESSSNYGVFNAFYKEKLGMCTWLKRDDLNNARRRLIRNYKKRGSDLITGTINLVNDDNNDAIPSNMSINENNSVPVSSMSSSTSSSSESSKKLFLLIF